MQPEAGRPLRLCVVQLDVIPQTRKYSLWEPAEPRLDRIADASGAQDRRMLSVAELAHESGDTEMYENVLNIQAAAMEKRLDEVLNFTAQHQADIVVLPE